MYEFRTQRVGDDCTVTPVQQMCQPRNAVAPSKALVEVWCRHPVCSHEYPYVGFFAVPDYSLSYVYVFAFFVVGAIFVTVLLTLSRLVAPRKATKEKLRTYESGEEPIGQAWGRYPTHFYVFALLFVVFDVEVIFHFPWAVLFRSLGVTGLIEVIVFIAILVVGLFYAWKKDALNWY